MDAAAGGVGVVLLFGLLILAVALLMAPLKLFAIHRELKNVVAELRALRAEVPGVCALRK